MGEPEWDTYSIHGALMFCAVGVFTTTSVAIALNRRYFQQQQQRISPNNNNSNSSWFDFHLKFQLLGFLLSVSGFVLVFSQQSTHFSTLHSKLGLCYFLITGLLQPSLGLPEDSQSPKNRRISLKRHSIVGQTALALGYVTAFLGMQMLGLPSSYFVAFTLWVVLVFSGLLITYYYKYYNRRL